MSDAAVTAMIPLARATLASAGMADATDGLVWRIAVSFAKVQAEERGAERKRLIDIACRWCREGKPMCPDGCDTHRSPGHHVWDERAEWMWWFPCEAQDIKRAIRAGGGTSTATPG